MGITFHFSPFTVHRSPFTVHRSPFTVHPSPFTLHRSPFFRLTEKLKLKIKQKRIFIAWKMKTKFILMSLCICLCSGCWLTRKVDTHQFVLKEMYQSNVPLTGWRTGNLKDEAADYLICHSPYDANLYSVIINDLQGKALSQINLSHKILDLHTLIDKRNNDRLLFISSNDADSLYLMGVKYLWQIPLRREDKYFASLERTDRAKGKADYIYNGHIVPQMLEDIDGDGKTELLCSLVDFFTARPRGLLLYDFETGAIKWQYDMPCIARSILWDDFDGNGSKEIIISNDALRNTEAVINGLDDGSGWLVVLSTRGKVLYQDKVFSGYGRIYLESVDVDQNGTKEIYAVNCTWGAEKHNNIASVLSWNGKRLIKDRTLELPSTLEPTQFPHFLQKMGSTSDYYLHLVDTKEGLLILDTDLKPVKHSYKGFISQIWDIGDLDRDGNKELFLQKKDGSLEILDRNYYRKARIRNPYPAEIIIGANLVSTGFDTNPLIAIGTNKQISFYEYKSLSAFAILLSLLQANALILFLLVLLLYIALLIRNFYCRKATIKLIDSFEHGILLVTRKGKIKHFNFQIRELYNNSEEPQKLLLDSFFPSLVKPFRDFCSGNLKAGTYIGTLNNNPQSKVYQVYFVYRVSGRKLYAIVIRPYTEESAIAEKMEWAEIARRLSHHVRRHITNILLVLETLDIDANPENNRYYQIIRSEIDKVRIFTHAFQRFTELQDYQLELQDIIPSIEHCLARIQFPPNIKLIKNWSLTSISAYIEPIRFEEALTNIINNALEAMPEEGTLHISVKEFPLASSPQGQQRVLIEIEDTGKGIPAKYLEDIWKPFFTTNQSGTGIGIPETKKIIDSMGGLMSIQSEENVGTVVSIWLKGATDAGN